MPLSLNRWKAKVCVVTGASSGIGATIAEQLALSGITVVAVARRKERLQDLEKLVSSKNGSLHPFPADITKEEDILKLFKWTKDNLGPIHILVNASGIAKAHSPLINGDAKYWKEIFDTNVLGLCITTREAVKSMRENSVDGHIIHINSIAGHMVVNFPGNNVYPASKYAVTALTESLRHELNDVNSKIRVTSISPGMVNTDLFKTAAGDVPLPVPPSMVEYLQQAPKLESIDVADAVIYALSTPPHVQVHEIIIRPVGGIV